MPAKKIELTVEEAEKRLDVFIAEKIEELSREKAKKLIKEGRILVNGQKEKPSYKLKAGDQIIIEIPEEKREEGLKPQPIEVQILYEDDHLIAVDKPSGMVVHPGAGNQEGTLVNALLYLRPELEEVGSRERPGIVHRLDKETSGIIVVAKDNPTYYKMQKLFQQRRVKKSYIAFVWGLIDEKGIIDLPIGRDPVHRKKISPRAKKKREAITFYERIETFEKISMVKACPTTGRTHQIRVHFSATGHPILADPLYSRKKTDLISRLALHSFALSFQHPVYEKPLIIKSPLPEDFRNLIIKLKGEETLFHIFLELEKNEFCNFL